MLCEKIFFDKYEFPVIKGLEYLMDERKPITDFLFINEPHEKFSMYFEVGQKPFEVADDSTTKKEYCLFEFKRHNKKICFYCPQRVPEKGAVMWYFYVEMFDEKGKSYMLPGQIRLVLADGCIRLMGEKNQIIEILEQIKLHVKYT